MHQIARYAIPGGSDGPRQLTEGISIAERVPSFISDVVMVSTNLGVSAHLWMRDEAVAEMALDSWNRPT